MCFLLTLTDYQFLIYFSIKIKYRQKVCLEKPYLEDYIMENDNCPPPGQVKFAISKKICFSDQIKNSLYVKGGTHPSFLRPENRLEFRQNVREHSHSPER